MLNSTVCEGGFLIRETCVLLLAILAFVLPTSAEFNQRDAKRVYASLTQRGTVIEKDDFVFLEVKWNAGTSDEEEEAELLAIERALKNYLLGDSRSSEDVGYDIPEVKSVVVEDSEKNGIHTQIIAFDAQALNLARDKVQSNSKKGENLSLWRRFLNLWKQEESK